MQRNVLQTWSLGNARLRLKKNLSIHVDTWHGILLKEMHVLLVQTKIAVFGEESLGWFTCVLARHYVPVLTLHTSMADCTIPDSGPLT